MSLSSYSKVVYGFGPSITQYLQVVSGTQWVCDKDDNHSIKDSRGYCPECGSKVIESPLMIPSRLVQKYSFLKGISVKEALKFLENYHHRINEWDGSLWVFGVNIVSGIGGLYSFQPGVFDPLNTKLIEGIQILNELFDGDLSKASYHLIVT